MNLQDFCFPICERPVAINNGQNSLNFMGQYGGSAMNKEVKDILNQRRKLMVLEYAKAIGSVSQTCQDLGIARSSFYEWKNAFEQEDKAGLLRKKPIPKNHPRKIKQSVIDKIIYLRKTYQLGAKRITYYLERYHGIVVSESSVTRTLVKYKINRLPKTASKRALHTRGDTAKKHQVIMSR